MLRYDIRFWDRDKQEMIYGAGISPNQLPIIKRAEDGALQELEGNFVPMICTGQKAVNGVIWEADVVECDVPAFFVEGVPASFVKARGVMQYSHAKGSFTVNIVANPQLEGQEFKVSNTRIIGCAIANPELLTINPNRNETANDKGSEGAPAPDAKRAKRGRKSA